jgi:hypothetical protein
MNHISHLLIAAALISSSIVHADGLPGEDALTIEVRALAADFATIIDKKGGGSVAVGEFSGSSKVKGSVGPRLQMVLKAELEKLKITVDPEDFRFEIKGDYQPVTDKDTDLLGIKLIGRLIDSETGEPLAEKPTGRFVFGPETVPTMLGLNMQPKLDADTRDISDAAKKALNSPTAHIKEQKLAVTPTSPYAIQVLVKRGSRYVARDITPDAKGRPFVELHGDEIYAIRLINNSRHNAAVDLRVDGVSSFAFSDTKSEFWIIAPGQHADIIGWHKSNATTTEFKVVDDFADSAAAKLHLKPSASIGLVTAAFRAAWDKESKPPADEMNLADLGGRQRNATGFGDDVGFRTTQVSLVIGQARDIISVRYNR